MKIKNIITEASNKSFSELENHLLFDEKPSTFLKNVLLDNDNNSFNSLLEVLYNLKEIKQNNINTNEDILTHTLYVIDEAAKYKHLANNKKAFMFAALLHDIGKIKTTTLNNNTNTNTNNYNLISSEMSRRILRDYIYDLNLRDNITSLIKHHTTYCSILNRSKSGDILNMIENTDIHDVALLSLCDKLGEKNLSIEDKKTSLDEINKFLDIMSSKTGVTYENLCINF